jgi:hypothetical protein
MVLSAVGLAASVCTATGRNALSAPFHALEVWKCLGIFRNIWLRSVRANAGVLEGSLQRVRDASNRKNGVLLTGSQVFDAVDSDPLLICVQRRGQVAVWDSHHFSRVC